MSNEQQQEPITAVFYSPDGNPEVWEIDAEKPEGYVSEAEWLKAHPRTAPEPSKEALEEYVATIRRGIDQRSIAAIREAILSDGQKGADTAKATLAALQQEWEDAAKVLDNDKK